MLFDTFEKHVAPLLMNLNY